MNKKIFIIRLTEYALYHSFAATLKHTSRKGALLPDDINTQIISMINGRRDTETVISILANKYFYIPYETISNYVCEYIYFLLKKNICKQIN